MEEAALKNLLSQVSQVLIKYEEIAAVTGENFNVFKILKLTTNEVRTHSAFLAELLNPKGSHGMRNSFLKLFIRQLNEMKLQDFTGKDALANFNVESAIVKVEEFVGYIDKEQVTGGRIDLVLKDNGENVIVIENKINAQDQNQQVERCRNAYPKAAILYLTLWGNEPTPDSKGDYQNEKDYLNISYSEFIFNWLTICLKEAVSFPLLRETLVQYQNLIKHLTGKTMNKLAETAIVDIVTKGPIENYIAAMQIVSSHRNILLGMLSKLQQDIADSLGSKWVMEKQNDFGLKDREIYFTKDNWGYNIVFCFDKDFSDLHWGIFDKRKVVCQDMVLRAKVIEALKSINEVGKIFTNLNNNIHYLNWFWYAEYKPWGSFDDRDKFDKTAAKHIARSIEALYEMASKVLL